MTRPLKATKDLPARAILGSADLKRLRGSTPTVIMPVRATPLPGSVLASAPSSPWPPLKDVAGVVAPSVAAANDGAVQADVDVEAAANDDGAPAVAAVAAGAAVTADPVNATAPDNDAEDLAAAGLAPTGRRRGPLLAIAAVVALIVVAIAVVAAR